MNLCKLKLFAEKTPILISFQMMTKVNEGIKAHIHTFNKAIPHNANDNKKIQPHRTLKNNKLASKDKTARNNRFPLARDGFFQFPIITDTMKFKKQCLSFKDIKRPQAKLLKGQNQLIYEKLREKHNSEKKEKTTKQSQHQHQPNIRTDIGFFQQVPLSKSLSREHCVLPSTKSHISIKKKRSDLKDNHKTTINFFKQSNSVITIKGIKREATTLNDELRKSKANIDNDLLGSSYDKKSKSFTEKDKDKEKWFLNSKNASNHCRLNDDTILGNKSKTFDKPIQTKKKNIIRTTKKIGSNDSNDADVNMDKDMDSDFELDTINNNPIKLKRISHASFQIDNHNHACRVKENNKTQTIDKDKNFIHYPNIVKPSENDLDNCKQNNYKEDNGDDREKEANHKKMRSSSSFTLKDINVSNIINRVIESNKRAAEASSKNFFAEIGKDFKNTHMYKSNINFFYSNNTAKHSTPSVELQQDTFTVNSINIQLTNPIEWKKHEDAWSALHLNSSLPSNLEGALVPPNDNDGLASSYFKLFPSMISHSEYSKTESLSQTSDYCLSLVINDKLQNPKVEMRKWKDAYKRVIHRWHPDKLIGMLGQYNLKDKNKAMLIQKKSTVIINNTNVFYKKIIETLTKINQAKMQR